MLKSSELEEKDSGLEIKTGPCWQNHEKIGSGISKLCRLWKMYPARASCEIRSRIATTFMSGSGHLGGTVQEPGRMGRALANAVQFAGWVKGNQHSIGNSLFSYIIVYLCKVSSVEDEAVGKHFEILPSIAK